MSVTYKLPPKATIAITLSDGSVLNVICEAAKDGQNIRLKGKVNTFEDLTAMPTSTSQTVIVGDSYVVQNGAEAGHLYTFTGDEYAVTGTAWTDCGNIVGDSSVLTILSAPFAEAGKTGTTVTSTVQTGTNTPVVDKFKVFNGDNGADGKSLVKFEVTSAYDEDTKLTTVTIVSQIENEHEKTETFTLGGSGGSGSPYIAFSPVFDSTITEATGEGSIAIGSGAVSIDESVVIGHNSKAAVGHSVVVGAFNKSELQHQVIVGANSTAAKEHSISIGSDINNVGAHAICIGSGSASTGDSSVAIGSSTSGKTETISIGQGASVSKDSSLAIGVFSECCAENSVALGNGSLATRDNTVAIGTTNAPRQITNVAAATMENDAVNFGQVKGMLSGGEIESEAKDTAGVINMKMSTQGTTGEGWFALYNSENLNRMTVTYVGGTLAENHNGVVVSLLQNDLCKFPSRNKNNNSVQLTEIGSTYDMYTTVAGSGIVDMVITVPMSVKVNAGGYTLKLKVQGYDKNDNPLIPQNLQFTIQVVSQ